MVTSIVSRARQFGYLALILSGAAFVLVYRGPYWPFVRGYMGDWLIVQFIYGIARLWISSRWRYPLAVAVLLFSLVVELLQGLAAGSIPHTLAAELTIGSTFDPLDVAAYTLGVATALFTERYWKP